MLEEARAAGELWERIAALAAGLEPGDWSRPTPCARWDVKDVVAHVAGLQTAMDGSAPQPAPPDGWQPEPGLGPLDAWTEAGVVARRDWTPAQVLAELDVARAGHVARLEEADPDAEAHGPLGRTDMRGLYAVRMFDLWTHEQDLLLALGRPVDLDASGRAAQDACRHVFRAVPPLAVKRAGMGEGQLLRVTVADHAPFDGVLEVVEGRARWGEQAAAADEVWAKPGALALLLAGRGEPGEWRDQGALKWSGALADAFVMRARVFGG